VSEGALVVGMLVKHARRDQVHHHGNEVGPRDVARVVDKAVAPGRPRNPLRGGPHLEIHVGPSLVDEPKSAVSRRPGALKRTVDAVDGHRLWFMHGTMVILSVIRTYERGAR
jgi:hypothetical protein